MCIRDRSKRLRVAFAYRTVSEPVSYTHLDVYKRQTCTTASTKFSESRRLCLYARSTVVATADKLRNRNCGMFSFKPYLLVMIRMGKNSTFLGRILFTIIFYKLQIAIKRVESLRQPVSGPRFVSSLTTDTR